MMPSSAAAFRLMGGVGLFVWSAKDAKDAKIFWVGGFMTGGSCGGYIESVN